MIRIAVPATSANLGIGFDCLGIALDIHNYFEVEISDYWQFEGFESRFCNEDNLFVVSYKKALDALKITDQKCYVKIETNIPVCRGLGSSASLIVGGIYAANQLNGNKLSNMEMLELATELEGHPDNAAPAIFGNICICNNTNNQLTMLNKIVNAKWHFGVWIPDFELSTEMARSVLPKQYERKDVITNISSALLAIEALSEGNEELLPMIMNDTIHEPYRKKLISGFDEAKKLAFENNVNAFIISGSGSTCLSISKQPLAIDCFNNWKILNVKPANQGVHLCQMDF